MPTWVKSVSLMLIPILYDVAEEKLAFYIKYEKEGKFSKLHCKCLSDMKTQFYSPEYKFDTIRSTPDRLPHKAL